MPYNPQTLESFERSGLELSAICANGHPPRHVIADNAVLMARFGRGARVQAVMTRIVCAECRAHVQVHVAAKSQRTITGGW